MTGRLTGADGCPMVALTGQVCFLPSVFRLQAFVLRSMSHMDVRDPIGFNYPSVQWSDPREMICSLEESDLVFAHSKVLECVKPLCRTQFGPRTVGLPLGSTQINHSRVVGILKVPESRDEHLHPSTALSQLQGECPLLGFLPSVSTLEVWDNSLGCSPP